MIADRDIFRSAQAMIDQFGQDAPMQAARRAGVLLEAGDMDGLAVWKRILRAIDELQSKEIPPGTAVN